MIHKALFAYCIGWLIGGYTVSSVLAHFYRSLAWTLPETVIAWASILSWIACVLSGMYFIGRRDEHESATPET